MNSNPDFDPSLDLVLDRVIDVPVEKVWDAWTVPEQVERWFCPAPWSTSGCQIDLRPGGAFITMMHSPEGETFPNVGCYLEIIPGKKLVFTDAMLPGYRPSGRPFMTAIITMTAEGNGTRYIARVMHADAETRKKHEEMGFQVGWNKALDQLVAHVKSSGDFSTR